MSAMLSALRVLTVPLPLPAVQGHDGMPASAAGLAMKLHDNEWVPVERFDPPLSADEQARANQKALENYADRCAEYSVKGAVASGVAA